MKGAVWVAGVRRGPHPVSVSVVTLQDALMVSWDCSDRQILQLTSYLVV